MIASGDDYDDIVDWGEAHLPLLRSFAEFHRGIPCADGLLLVSMQSTEGALRGVYKNKQLSAQTRGT